MPDSSKNPKLLRNLILNEISLVDRGANPGAQVLLFKRDTSKEHSMPDDSKKGLTPEQLVTLDKAEKLIKAHEDLTKSLDAMTKERDFAKDELKKVNDRLIKLEKASAENDGDNDVTKIELPEAVRKQIAATEAESAELKKRIQKMEDDKVSQAYIVKAEAFKNLSQKPEDLGPLLMRVALNKATSEDVVELEKILSAANEGLEDITKTHGDSSASDPESAIALLDKRTLEIMKSEKLTEAAAFAKAMDQDPALYAKYLDERNVQ